MPAGIAGRPCRLHAACWHVVMLLMHSAYSYYSCRSSRACIECMGMGTRQWHIGRSTHQSLNHSIAQARLSCLT
jgi:hypothetical protein